MEKTDFFVVDKDAFFKVGIDKFSTEEIEYRESCVNSLQILRSVDGEVRRDIADEGRIVSYLSERIIENDSSSSEFVYFITKGSCQVF